MTKDNSQRPRRRGLRLLPGARVANTNNANAAETERYRLVVDEHPTQIDGVCGFDRTKKPTIP